MPLVGSSARTLVANASPTSHGAGSGMAFRRRSTNSVAMRDDANFFSPGFESEDDSTSHGRTTSCRYRPKTCWSSATRPSQLADPARPAYLTAALNTRASIIPRVTGPVGSFLCNEKPNSHLELKRRSFAPRWRRRDPLDLQGLEHSPRLLRPRPTLSNRGGTEAGLDLHLQCRGAHRCPGGNSRALARPSSA